MHEGILAPASGRLQGATCGAWRSGVRAGAACVALLTAATLPAAAQEFSARTEMVEVYATVTDAEGRLLTDLTADEFVVHDDGRPQTIVTFTPGDVPLSLALAVDRSFSMRGAPLEWATTATRVLLNELTGDDRVTLVAIGSEVDVVVPLTGDRLAVDTAAHALDAWGTTALHDAVVKAVDVIEPAPGRRALILVSDGQERHSLRTAEQVYERLRASDVMVYPVALARRPPPVFQTLAALTGGRTVATRRPEELPRIFGRFASELRHQYLLGYEPADPQTPGYHRLEVSVTRAGAVVRARAGYTVDTR